MSIRLVLTIYCLIYLVNAKLSASSADGKKYVAEDFDREMSKEEGRDINGDYFYIKSIRNPRLSNDHTARPARPRNETAKVKRTNKPNVVLVKKPIPKFTDNGSDEDYLTRLRFPNGVADSIEHEDEDFSVDDYDFDVNHDEYSGRGKPLEPRVKVKVSRQRLKPIPEKLEKTHPVLSEIKVIMPQNERKPSVKVTRNTVTDKMKEEEYDDEFSESKWTEKYRKPLAKEDVVSSEKEESKEDEMKRPVRIVRSPPLNFGTYVEKLDEKNLQFKSKMLSYLPLFSLSYSKQQQDNEEVIAGHPWIDRSLE